MTSIMTVGLDKTKIPTTKLFKFLKRCGNNNNKDEDNSLKTLNDKNQQQTIHVAGVIHFLTLLMSAGV